MIPDPQVEETFQSSRLNWKEIEEKPHLFVLNLYKELLQLRHSEACFQNTNKFGKKKNIGSKHSAIQGSSLLPVHYPRILWPQYDEPAIIQTKWLWGFLSSKGVKSSFAWMI